MEKNSLKKARRILDVYLESKKHRKTPERYAILNAVFSIAGHFNLEELSDYLQKENFRVSRATLYNTLKLFLELRLIVRHKLQDGTKYETNIANESHCHQVCTVCGKITEISVPKVSEAINNVKLHRFHCDGFALYIYGMCSSCHLKITRKLNNKQTKNNKDIGNNDKQRKS